MEFFFHHQRIQAVRVISRPGFDHGVPVAFIERERGTIVDGGFKPNRARSQGAQAIFRGPEQLRSDARPPCSRDYVDGNDVALGAAMSYEKACDCFGVVKGDKRERFPAAHVVLEFRPRVGNARREAFLIDAPQSIEVFRLEVADGERHVAIVAGRSARRWASLAGVRLRRELGLRYEIIEPSLPVFFPQRNGLSREKNLLAAVLPS